MKRAVLALCLPLFCCNEEDNTGRAEDAQAVQAKDASPPTDARAPVTRDATVPRDAAPPVDARVPSEEDAATEVIDAQTPQDSGVAPEDDAGPGGASRCSGAGLTFCDDFEGAQLDSAWTNKQGTVELDSSKAMRGQKSLHVRAENNKVAIIAHRASFPMPNERFWVRTFVNIKNLPTPNWAHWSMLWTIPEGAQWSVEEHRFGGQNQSDKKLYWAVGTDHGKSGDWTNIDNSSTVQLDKWTCVELLIDANMDVSQVYRDGVEYPKLATTRSVQHQGNASVPYDIPAPRTLWLGFFYYQGETPGTTYDLWFDSFAIDDERIGCTR
ncbi:MAG: hypothetical protein ABW352_15510 [Polyangiales bacterium]